MYYLLLCFGALLGAYILNILYVTVFYHRALAHNAIRMHPALEKFVIATGNWVTGLDPKAWVCMHRMHHIHSDTALDPHSPKNRGIWKVLPMQLFSYNRTIAALGLNSARYVSVVSDIRFPVSWLNRNGLWYLPYLLHAGIAVMVGTMSGLWLLAGCYWIGMMSHPIQGWMVNALAHRFGYRNFATDDESTNNSFVSWCVFGEGYQNNHHHRPSSPKFSVYPGEVDLGFALCRGLARIGLVTF